MHYYEIHGKICVIILCVYKITTDSKQKTAAQKTTDSKVQVVLHSPLHLMQSFMSEKIHFKQNKNKKQCRLCLNYDFRDPWLPSSGSFAYSLKTLYQLQCESVFTQPLSISAIQTNTQMVILFCIISLLFCFF